jgi:hypothetical protein
MSPFLFTSVVDIVAVWLGIILRAEQSFSGQVYGCYIQPKGLCGFPHNNQVACHVHLHEWGKINNCVFIFFFQEQNKLVAA